MSITKQVLIKELEEQLHPERVEDVIFWALEYYHKTHRKTWGGIIAGAIVSDIKEAEQDHQAKNN